MRVKKTRKSQKLDFSLSLSDLMSGLLFIFIIILIFYIQEAQSIKDEYSENRKLQRAILEEIKSKLKKEGIKAEYVENHGSLRLPDQYFFKSGKYELSVRGKKVIKSVKKYISEALSCNNKKIKKICKDGKINIDSFVIEGHSDCEGIPKKLQEQWPRPVHSNIHLSAMRAISFFDLLNKDDNIKNLRNLNNERILSISGYGSNRPENNNAHDDKKCKEKRKKQKRRDRRIEFTIIMPLPKKLKEVSL